MVDALPNVSSTVSDAFLVFCLMAFIAGAALPTQAAVNAKLGDVLGSPVWAVVVSFVVGAAVLFSFQVISRAALPGWSSIADAPWWAWCGGVIGAFFVSAVTITAPKLGASAVMALVIAGQMVYAVLVDHYGLFGIAKHPVNMARIIGSISILIGSGLIVSR